MLSAINNIKVSHGHWKRGASDLELYEAVQELLDNTIYAEGKPNASEAHIYYKQGTKVGPGEVRDILIIRDNGTGIASTFFAEEASSLGHTRSYTAEHLVEKKGLGRHGGGMKISLPPLADDVYTLVCHGHGKIREKYIVRNGETLNKALATTGKESLQWAYLPVPADFVFNSRLEVENGISAADQLHSKSPRHLKELVFKGADKMLEGEDSTFKSLDALLDLFGEFGEGTGTMFVIAAPCSDPPNKLVPIFQNYCMDLVREHDNPANRVGLHQDIAQVYVLDPFFRGLREALWKQHYPEKPFKDLAIKFFVQGQMVGFSSNSIVAAAQGSGSYSPVIPIQHPRGTLGWLLLAYQHKEQSARFDLANDKKSGLHMAIVCRILNRKPSFLSKADVQSQYMVKAEYFERKRAYDHLVDMVSVDEALLDGVPEDMRPKVPFTEKEALKWNGCARSASARVKGRNYLWTLGGAGVTGVFVANEEFSTVNVDKNNLKDNEFTPYLHAKLMEQMMSWVYSNPPPDMAAARADNTRAAAERAAKAAKAAAARAAREAEGAVVKEEAGPLTPPARTPSGRAAKSRASNSIAKKLALEDAPEHVALGARLRKKGPAAQKKGAKKRLGSVADGPQTPGRRGKRQRSADILEEDTDEDELGDVDAAWDSFLADEGQHSAGSAAQRSVGHLFGRKVISVAGAPPTAEQLKRLDVLFKALGKMPATS